MPDSPDVALADSRNRFPVGAIILIVLGILFFFGSSGWLRHFPVQRIIPFLLIATGVWIFVRKMTNSGLSIADDGTPVYQLRLFRALRGAIWIIMIGVLFLLDTFDILPWAHSWPLLIIVAGLMAFFERSASSAAAQLPYGYAPYSPAAPSVPAQPVAAASTGTSVVPSTPANEESR